MDRRSPRSSELKGPICAVPVVRAFAAGILVFSLAGSSRPPSKALEIPRPFKLAVRETRDETFLDASKDSIVTRRSVSSLTHFGRIERTAGRSDRATESGQRGGREKPDYAVYTDSLLFRSDAPLRYAGCIRRDTIIVTSFERGPSTRTTTLDTDKEMLACIFEGPSLLVSVPEKNRPADVRDQKARCAGGLYRRLNLPVTFGTFTAAIPPGRVQPGTRWKTETACPSFTGLGLSLRLNLACGVVAGTAEKGAARNIEIACDTTLTNFSTVAPGGQQVDIISARIRVRGILRPWRDLTWVRAGELGIEEDIRYTRPGLESPALEKRSRVEILLEPR